MHAAGLVICFVTRTSPGRIPLAFRTNEAKSGLSNKQVPQSDKLRRSRHLHFSSAVLSDLAFLLHLL
jgi:hypothetical protein